MPSHFSDRGRSGRALLLVSAALTIAVAALVVVVAVGDDHSGATRGSGPTTAERRPVPPFRAVDIAGAAKVVVRVGPATAVTVHAEKNILPLVVTRVSDGTLVVSQRGSFNSRETWVEVRTPVLDVAMLSGAGDLRIAGVRADRFRADLSGAGLLDVDGRARSLRATVSGAGAARLEHLVVGDARAVVSGTGTAAVNVTGRLDAVVSGVGSILYRGAPVEVHERVTGTGTVVEG